MRRSLIVVISAFLLVCLNCVQGVRAASKEMVAAQHCTDSLYNRARGKSAEQLFALSGQVFSYEYAAKRAASRNRLNWDNLSPSVRQQYIERLHAISQSRVMPALAKALKEKPVVKRAQRKDGVLVIYYTSGPSLRVNESCTIIDGTAYGVSLSTLAAEALKDKRR